MVDIDFSLHVEERIDTKHVIMLWNNKGGSYLNEDTFAIMKVHPGIRKIKLLVAWRLPGKTFFYP